MLLIGKKHCIIFDCHYGRLFSNNFADNFSSYFHFKPGKSYKCSLWREEENWQWQRHEISLDVIIGCCLIVSRFTIQTCVGVNVTLEAVIVTILFCVSVQFLSLAIVFLNTTTISTPLWSWRHTITFWKLTKTTIVLLLLLSKSYLHATYNNFLFHQSTKLRSQRQTSILSERLSKWLFT